MRTVLLLSLLAFAGAATAARGTVVDMPSDGGDASVTLPRRAMTMAQVERHYGIPRVRRDTVGDPPITRWDYADFSVFFEHDRVLHAVVPGDFPEIRHRDQLQR
jgi:hypothetical protein